ncbi:Protein of unknown function [Gryllus bimaculatus]|nr:Protein of unknown function [Gryllus bimaculatus]
MFNDFAKNTILNVKFHYYLNISSHLKFICVLFFLVRNIKRECFIGLFILAAFYPQKESGGYIMLDIKLQELSVLLQLYISIMLYIYVVLSRELFITGKHKLMSLCSHKDKYHLINFLRKIATIHSQ